MKNHLNYAALVAILVGLALAGALVTSCRKDPLDLVNPKVDKLPEAGFSLEGTEKRSDGEYVLPWTISKVGGVDSVLEELDELTLTPYNTFTLEAVPDNENGFPGINARTDNSCIKLERLDQNRFAMAFLVDGDATVKVWNGKEAGNTTIEFKVKARKSIPVEGLLVRIDDKEDVLIKAVTGTSWETLYQAMTDNYFYHIKYLERKKGMSLPDPYTMEDVFRNYTREELNLRKLEILHLVPENTTYRRLNYSNVAGGYPGICSFMFCDGEFDWFEEVRSFGSRYNIPNGTDASMLYGKSIFFGSSPGTKVGIHAERYCPPEHFYLMQVESKARFDQVAVSGVRALANTVIVVD